jgi:hypothetical protein
MKILIDNLNSRDWLGVIRCGGSINVGFIAGDDQICDLAIGADVLWVQPVPNDLITPFPFTLDR